MSSIRERVLQGKPLDDITVFDCHGHMGYWHNFNCPGNDAKGMISSMDRLGIDRICITAHPSIGPDYIYGNDMALEAVLHNPERFMAYVTLNPNYPDGLLDEIKRCMKHEGAAGIKLHPGMHGHPVDHPNYGIVYEVADTMKLPVLIHTWGLGDVAAIKRLAPRYPGAGFIMAHSGGHEVHAMNEALKLMSEYENVYGDLAISFAYEGNVEWFVKEATSKKILFGTDMPFLDPRPTFCRLGLADISDDEKSDIFGSNFLRMLSECDKSRLEEI